MNLKQWSRWKKSIIVIVKIAADGPNPLTNSMLSFAAVAITVNGELLKSISRNLEIRADTLPDDNFNIWWSERQLARKEVAKSQIDPTTAITDLINFVEMLRQDYPTKNIILASECLSETWMFIDYYLRVYGGRVSLFSQEHALDIQSFLAGMYGIMRGDISKQVFSPKIVRNNRSLMPDVPFYDAYASAGVLVDHIRYQFKQPKLVIIC